MGAASAARQAERAAQRAQLAHEIEQLERLLLDPEFRRDRAAVSRLLAEDFVEIGASGRLWSRAQVLEALEHETSAQITLSDFHLELAAGGLLLVTYHSRHANADGAVRECMRSSTWLLLDGGWRLRFHQGTPLPAVE